MAEAIVGTLIARRTKALPAVIQKAIEALSAIP